MASRFAESSAVSDYFTSARLYGPLKRASESKLVNRKN